MLTKDQDRAEMQKPKVRILFLLASLPLIFAVVMATYYGNQKRPSESLVAEIKNLAPIGEILQTDTVEQHIKCPVDKFESFRLMAATYKRTNTAIYKVTIIGGQLYPAQEFIVDASTLKDNAWVDFKLQKPLERCKGRPLKLIIESTNATSGNAITFYTASRYYEGKILLPLRADLFNKQLAMEVNTVIGGELAQPLPSDTPTPKIADTGKVGSSSLSSKLDQLDNFGELLIGQTIEQSIVCPVENLSSIRVMPATYQRSNTARYKMSLSHASGVLGTLNFSGQDVRDNIYFRLPLPKPLEKCFGQPLTLKIEAIDAKPGNALTFYHRPSYYTGVLKASQKADLAGRQLLIEMNY